MSRRAVVLAFDANRPRAAARPSTTPAAAVNGPLIVKLAQLELARPAALKTIERLVDRMLAHAPGGGHAA